MKPTKKTADARADKKAGIKEGSKRDKALDKKKGIKGGKYAMIAFAVLLGSSPAMAYRDEYGHNHLLYASPEEEAIERQTFQQHLDADAAAQAKIFSDGLARDAAARLDRGGPTTFDTYCYPGGYCTTYGR